MDLKLIDFLRDGLYNQNEAWTAQVMGCQSKKREKGQPMKGQLSIIGLSNELEIESKKWSVVSMDCERNGL
jgi:hypothetical protein